MIVELLAWQKKRLEESVIQIPYSPSTIANIHQNGCYSVFSPCERRLFGSPRMGQPLQLVVAKFTDGDYLKRLEGTDSQLPKGLTS